MLQQTHRRRRGATTSTASNPPRAGRPVNRTGRGRGCRGHGRMGGAWVLRPGAQPAEIARRVVADDHGGTFPRHRRRVARASRQIGPYTAAAIAAIAFDRHAAVMDGNVERVLSRLFSVETPLPASKPVLRTLAERLTPATRPGLLRAGGDGPRAPRSARRNSPACGHLPAHVALRRARARYRRRSAAQDAEKGQSRPAPGYRLPCASRGWRRPARDPPGQGPAGRHARLARHRLGGRRARGGAAACPPAGTIRDWRCATPSPISTCASGSASRMCRWMRHPTRGQFAPPRHIPGPQACLR